MCRLTKLFCKHKTKDTVPPLPAWEETVDMMYDKELDGRIDEVVEVIYSHDRTKRFVFMKSEHGYYKYSYEILYGLTEEEWMYTGSNPDALPAIWEGADGRRSFFDDLQGALDSVKNSPEYKTDFF